MAAIPSYAQDWLRAFSQRVRHFATISLPGWGTDLDALVHEYGTHDAHGMESGSSIYIYIYITLRSQSEASAHFGSIDGLVSRTLNLLQLITICQMKS